MHPLSSLLASAGSGSSGGSGSAAIVQLGIFLLIPIAMYFLLIRPQRQRQKEQEKLIASIKVGDHVVLAGGEHGIITSAKERTVMVKVADNVKIEYERSAIASVSKKSDVIEASTDV